MVQGGRQELTVGGRGTEGSDGPVAERKVGLRGKNEVLAWRWAEKPGCCFLRHNRD
jgi:hypothetical protein